MTKFILEGSGEDDGENEKVSAFIHGNFVNIDLYDDDRGDDKFIRLTADKARMLAVTLTVFADKISKGETND
jgi:hypothetical protein